MARAIEITMGTERFAFTRGYSMARITEIEVQVGNEPFFFESAGMPTVEGIDREATLDAYVTALGDALRTAYPEATVNVARVPNARRPGLTLVYDDGTVITAGSSAPWTGEYSEWFDVNYVIDKFWRHMDLWIIWETEDC